MNCDALVFRKLSFKMKCLIILLSLAVLNFTIAEKYTGRYDDLNVDDIISNKRLLGSYMKCILDKGRCTPEGKEIKVHLIDGIQTGCSKCTDPQKQKARKVVNHLRNHEQQFWEDLKKKYDPENKYQETYEAFLASDD